MIKTDIDYLKEAVKEVAPVLVDLVIENAPALKAAFEDTEKQCRKSSYDREYFDDRIDIMIEILGCVTNEDQRRIVLEEIDLIKKERELCK